MAAWLHACMSSPGTDLPPHFPTFWPQELMLDPKRLSNGGVGYHSVREGASSLSLDLLGHNGGASETAQLKVWEV